MFDKIFLPNDGSQPFRAILCFCDHHHHHNNKGFGGGHGRDFETMMMVFFFAPTLVGRSRKSSNGDDVIGIDDGVFFLG